MSVRTVIAKALSRMVFGRQSPWLGHMLPRSRYNHARDVGDGMSSSVVVAPVLWIARTLPEAPIAVERDGEIERDHAMAQLLRNPNPYYSGHLLQMALAIDLVTDGNAYLLKVRNRMRGPVELWFVPHWLMDSKAPDDGSVFVSHYEYRPLGIPIRVDVSDVVHLRFGMDPQNVRKGLSQLKCLLREVVTDDEASAFTWTLLRNAGVPGLLASPMSENAIIPEDEVKPIKEYLKKAVTGDARGEPLVISRPLNVEQFGFNPQQLDLAKLREIPEERVCAVLGVPAAVVGFGSGLAQTKVGATMSEMREMAYESCIIPIQRLIASELDRQLLPDFEPDPEKCGTVFDLTEVRVLQEDQNRKAVRVNTMVQGGWMTVAAAKKQMGEEVLAGDDVYLRPWSTMVVPARASVEEQQAATARATTVATEPAADEEQKSRFLTTATKGDAEDRRRFALSQLRQQRRLAALFSGELSTAFRGLGNRAAEAWERIAAETGAEFREFPRDSIVLKRLTDEELQRLVGLVMADLDVEVLEYGPHYLRVALATIDGLRGAFGLGVNLSEPMEMRILAEGGKRQGLVDMRGQARESLFQTLSSARDTGAGPGEIAQLIRDQIPAGPWSSAQVRSEVIARTETAHAQNTACLEAYRAADTVTAIQLVDGQLGDRSCDICRARDGQIVSVEEAETIMREHEHPNGTLSLTPVVGRRP